jgi:peptidoglycan-N-acetylglucosamine deacetylase
MDEPMKILTVDVEDWFHILDNAETATESEWVNFPHRLESGLMRILDVFDWHQQKATFFVVGWIARKYPDAVAEITRRGHEIACHSDLHQLVYKQNPLEFEDDLKRSLDTIEAATNYRPTAYRAPGFSITEDSTWAFDILARNGIDTDCSVFPARRCHGGLPMFSSGKPCRLETIEGRMLRIFPIGFQNIFGSRLVFSGGGYFRLTPKMLLKHWFDKADYAMAYFHPRDFDPYQPQIPGLSSIQRFKSYVGLKTALSKLESVMEFTQFIPLREAAERVDWNKTQKVTIN